MEEKMHDIYQTVITFPYFNHEVPILNIADETRYIPVIALCEMVGLHDSHIPLWRKLVLWANARKSSYYHTVTGRKRIVWYLHIGAVPLWCGCFDWSRVSLKCQEQLPQATEAWYEALAQIQEILSNYKQMSCLLFEFLTTYENANTKLSQLVARLHPILDHFDLSIQLEELITRGKDLIREATDHARQMVQEQVTNPTIDTVRLDDNDQIHEHLFLPLIPVFSSEICTKFFEYVSQISQRYQSFVAFLEDMMLF